MENKPELSEETKELYREQARNRAGQTIGHLVDENDLSKMWTLTYAKEVNDRDQALNDFKLFMKRLNYHLDKKVPYVAVIEVQREREKKTGKAVLHFHLATDNRYIEKSKFQEIWGHGNVRFSTYKDGRTIPGDRKAVATYMSKYLKKDMQDNPDLAGRKMYLASKGLKRPPRTNGILQPENWLRLEQSCTGYEIKGRPDIKGYNLNPKKILGITPEKITI